MTSSARSNVAAGLAVIAALVCVGLAYARVPLPVFLTAFGVAAVIPWALDSRTNTWLYLAALGIQMPQDTYHIRFAIADCFLMPVIGYSALAYLRARQWPRRELTAPIALVLAAFVIASIRAFLVNGSLSNWALGNKDVGILYLVAGFIALTRQLGTRDDLERAILVFVGGVSATNAIALVAGVGGSYLGFWPENILFNTAGRLNGWMLNPTSNGSLLMTALLLALVVRAASHGGGRWLGLANTLLLITSIMLALSRSVWIATGAGAFVLLALGAWRAMQHRRLFSGVQLAAAIIAMSVPALVMGTIVVAQRQHLRRVAEDLEAARAASQLRTRLIATCAAKWDEMLCKDLRADIDALLAQAKTAAPAASVPPPPPVAAAPPPVSAPPSPAVTPPSPPSKSPFTVAKISNPEGAVMNARGLEDRAAIIRQAWRKYTASTANEVWGIGLGTFFATSSAIFGVPIIIHSSPAWFLIELGPLGFVALLWLLWRAIGGGIAARDALESLGLGLVAALVGWAILSTLNEAFYFRHFWLLLVLTERVMALSRAGQTE